MERATEVFVALFLTVIALSHMAQPRAWVEFFSWLRARGHAGVFVNGFLSLGFGLRWFSPLGPLRFEVGFPLTRRPIDEAYLFEFTIGNFF